MIDQKATIKVKNPARTRWAHRYKQVDPNGFAEALDLVSRLSSVVISQRDDHSFKGDFLWAIIPDENKEFWLDALPTIGEAKALCRVMGWPVREIHGAMN